MREPDRNENGWFGAVARTMSDGLLVMDADARIVFVNEAIRAIFGYEPDELVGESAARLFADGEEHAPPAALSRLPGTPDASSNGNRFEVSGVRADGARILLEVTYGRVRQGGERFFTALLRDISERQRTDSRLRLQARLLDAVGEAIIATDPAGRILYWNAGAERLYGWRSEEVVGRPVEEVTPTEMSRPQAREIMGRLREGESWTGEFMVRDRTGRAFPVLVTDSPVLDDEAGLIGIIGASMEITDRKRAEEAQRFLAEAGRLLASSLDHEVTLGRVSRLAVPMLGDWCVVHLLENDRPMAVAHCTPGRRDEDTDDLEAVLTGTDGLLAQVLPSTDPVRLGPGHPACTEDTQARLRELKIRELLVVPLQIRGEPLGVMTFGRPGGGQPYGVEDLRLAHELAGRAASAIDNARLYRDAEESDRAKTDFLAVVSHELRTPLNAITGYAELLTGGVSGPLNDKQRGQIERIGVSARHLAHLIDEILTYARMEGGRDTLEPALTDVGETVRDAVSVLRPAADGKGLELSIDAATHGPELVTDPGKLRQIVMNLVSNAVKYTDEGHVRVAIRQLEDGIELTVKDSGVGIPTEEQERIFEPFRQVQAPNTRTVGGTGLGLSVSRRLVQVLGGRISVESTPGTGSTFTVWLPKDPPDGR
ncbi:MAG: PAS domain S-box protein [Gemmatimonadetes bacterium]|nr:PAS domain S-box protein [Gemmatimonadota bacterium]